jgi:hypothetical protein
MKKKASQESTAIQPLAADKKGKAGRKAQKTRESSSAKPPRHPVNPDRLAKIQIEEVSAIAATILADSPHESVRRAYELLDIAASAQAFLERSDNQSFEAGIDYHKSITAQKSKFERNLPSVICEIDEDGTHDKVVSVTIVKESNGDSHFIVDPISVERKNVSLDDILASLYPDGREVKKSERESRLKLFIGDLEGIHDLTKKAERFDQLKREGFPPNLVETIRVCFPDWWEKRVSLERAEAGKKGGQGQVLSEDDKRLGGKRSVEDLAAEIGLNP